MTTYVGADEAARLLGVTKPTLYAYVSRGLVDRRTAVDGRTSLYARDQIEQLAGRARRHGPVERPSIDVRISSAVTQLHDDALAYRGHDVVELVGRASFEQVAELLWTGEQPPSAPTWPVDRELLRRCRAAGDAAGPLDPIARLQLACVASTGDAALERGTAPTGAAADVARRIVALAPSLLGGPLRGTIASRLTAAYLRRPGDEVVAAVDRALALLADHELATSTLGVRVAASVRTDPAAAISAGLAIVRGALHGAAGLAATRLLAEAAEVGADVAVRRRLEAKQRLPGFGHTVYRHGDPRVAPLLDAVRRIPSDGHGVVDAVIAEAGRRIGHLPNVDLGLGALCHVAGLPGDAPVFAVARIVGWAAHYDEELSERPLRFRGLAAAR